MVPSEYLIIFLACPAKLAKPMRIPAMNVMVRLANMARNPSRSEEVATAVEVTQVQTIFDIGFVGLLVQTAFYVGLHIF